MGIRNIGKQADVIKSMGNGKPMYRNKGNIQIVNTKGMSNNLVSSKTLFNSTFHNDRIRNTQIANHSDMDEYHQENVAVIVPMS